MRIILDSFVVLCTLAALFIQGLSFFKYAVNSIYASNPQRAIQFSFLIGLLFLIFYQLKELKTIYKRQVVDFEDTSIIAKLKSLQYLGENILQSVIIAAFACVFDTFKKFKLKAIRDQKAYRNTCVIYSILRIIPALVILWGISKKPAFLSFLMEIFLISEGVVKILVLFAIEKMIERIAGEIDACLLSDKSFMQSILSQYQRLSSKLFIALSLDCAYRFLYLAVVLNLRSKTILLMKDLSNLLKIASIYLILDSLIEIIFINASGIRITFNENEKDKFFVFDEEASAIENK